MKIAMTTAEQDLLSRFLIPSRTYIEFGSGGSTVLACNTVSETVISVDSSKEWQDKVLSARPLDTTHKLQLVYVDIGPLKELGYPADDSRRDYWSDYHTKVWDHFKDQQADTYLIDGRFRIACFIQSMIHARTDSVVLVHDFRNRPHYTPMRDFGREIAFRENLSVFVRRPDFDVKRALDAVKLYSNNYH